MKRTTLACFTVIAVAGCGGGGGGSDAEPPKAYTKIAANGDVLEDSASEWSCVRDDDTGLIWESKQSGYQLRSADWSYSWYNSALPVSSRGAPDMADNCYYMDRCDTEKLAVDVNVTALCGYTDWRLPNARELRTLIWRPVTVNGTYNPSRYGPPVDERFFPYVLTGLYWSSTTASDSPDRAYVWTFTVNVKSYGLAKDRYAKAWLVRGEPLSEGPFAIELIAQEGGSIHYSGSECDQTTCGASVSLGEQLVLTAAAHYPFLFSGWDGCPDVRDNECVVDGVEDLTVTALFVSL